MSVHIRFWSDDTREEILGPFDYVAIKRSKIGGLTAVVLVDSNGTQLAWLSTLSPVQWYLSGYQKYEHMMVWEMAPVEMEHDPSTATPRTVQHPGHH